MRRLPNVGQVCSEVLERANKPQSEGLEKEAAQVPGTEYTVPVAQLLSKFATYLRSVNTNDLSLKEVQTFKDRVTEQQNGT